MTGIINVLKPPGMTSHDVVYYIRKRTGIKKVGHTGTLDPEAAGVLPVCIGKATKAVQYLTDKDKSYRANIKFGVVTETYDIYGEVVSENKISKIDEAAVKEILKGFVGHIEQQPPIYSAIKKNGKKLYEYALSGEEVKIEKRSVTINSMDFLGFIADDEIMIDVGCSKGTYIRSLCHDIGQELGPGACMSQLIRTASGDFSIDSAYTLEEIDAASAAGNLEQLITPVDAVFKRYKEINIKKSASNSALNGNPLYEKALIEAIDGIPEGEFVRLYLEDRFLALGIVSYNREEEKRYIKIDTLFV